MYKIELSEKEKDFLFKNNDELKIKNNTLLLTEKDADILVDNLYNLALDFVDEFSHPIGDSATAEKLADKIVDLT